MVSDWILGVRESGMAWLPSRSLKLEMKDNYLRGRSR